MKHGTTQQRSTRRGPGWRVLGALLAAGLVVSACAAGTDEDPADDEPDTTETDADPDTDTDPDPDTDTDPDPADDDDAGAGDATLTIAIPAYPSSWDQDFVGFDPIALALFKNVYPYLVDYDVTEVDGAPILDTENILPSFAESFESEDGRLWTLKLREGYEFPSGNELTADDVKWSKDRAFAAGANVAGIYRLIGLTDPEQVQVVDDYTVTFEQDFASALSPQIQAISLFVFDSEEAEEHATDEDPWAQEWAAQNPPTGGYYEVESATQGQEIVLRANRDYPGPDAPQVDTIRLLVVPSASNRRLQLEAGDVDIALGLSRRDISDLADADGIRTISSPSNEMVVIQMLTTQAPFDDVRVRQALAHAVPYDQIIDTVFEGDARRVRSPVPLDMPGYDEAGYPYDYDQDLARELLAEAGMESFETELVYAADDPEQQQLGVLVADALGQVGVDVTLSPLDPGTLGERRTSKNIPLQITYGQQWVNDVEYLLSTSLTEGAFLNYADYTNPRVQEIFESAPEVTDPADREALWLEVQEELAQDVPWLVIAQPNFNLPVRERVGGWVQPVDGLWRLRYLTVD